ncbi:MAG: cation:proton antiporter [Bacteroidetes bacterium]|nr:cation:proton antiporter [Bacteroidota bacterium]
MDFREYFKHIINQFNLPLESPILVFSLILLIILLSPVLLRKLNIPGIIGLIIAGVVIGPHGLHILERNSAVDLFSTIGLLYIMFIAGLELDLNEFKANKNKSLLFGFFTFAIPLSVGYPVCHYLLGYDFNTSFLTASMFATHTLVAYPIVSKFGVSKNQAVAITVGGTILTDTAVLIILAVILGNAQGGLTNEFWIRLGVSLIIFSLIMFLLIPRIAKWFFKKLESEKHSHYIFVLSVVFFAAFLAEAAGIEPIIGAFVAGLALNKLIPNSSALMNRIEFIGNSLFIPFFLISVGMIVNVKVIASGTIALIVAGTLSVVAISGKWLAAFLTQLVFKYSKAQRQLIFGLSGAHAAATLAVILVGYKHGIIDENILNGTIILILITCIVASFATEKASKQIVIESENDSADAYKTNGIHNEHILLPINNLNKLEKLLDFSIFIKDKKSANPISILTVVSYDNDAESNILKTRNKLESFVKQASASETKANVITTIDHNAASGISRISREIMADIVTLGWPSRTGIFDKLLGEKMESILKNIDKTVLVCQLVHPLALHKRVVVVVPRMAEYEKGFVLWVKKIAMLAQELSLSIVFYCCESTEKAINKVFNKYKFTPSLTYQSMIDWDDFLVIAKDIRKEDLFVLISARKGATSYVGAMDNLPSKMEKYFESNNLIVIYPQEYDSVPIERFSDISGEPINKSIEAVQKIGKEIGSIFKKQENQS